MRYDAILICTRNEKVRIVCRDIAEDVGEFIEQLKPKCRGWFEG